MTETQNGVINYDERKPRIGTLYKSETSAPTAIKEPVFFSSLDTLSEQTANGRIEGKSVVEWQTIFFVSSSRADERD